MSDHKKKYHEDRELKAREIIAAIDDWLRNFTRLDVSVGAVIQRWAMRELDFINYISDKWIGLDELRIKANDVLESYGKPRVPKPIWGPSIVDLKPSRQLFDWVSVPFPTFEIISTEPVKTRREELEGMTKEAVDQIFLKAQRKETKKSRINYILEAEKGDK